MKIWSIQPEEALKLLLLGKSFSSDRELVEQGFDNDWAWENAYNWLSGKMVDKGISLPTKYPVWGWVQWANEAKKRPDLRSISCSINKTDRQVLLELDVPESEMLLSDFDLWHFVLNYWYLPENESDELSFEDLCNEQGYNPFKVRPAPENLDKIIRSSWDKVLDLSWCNEYTRPNLTDLQIQAIFPSIKPEYLRSYKNINGRK